MKIIIAILFASLSACGQTSKTKLDKTKIDISSVDYIEISQQQNRQTVIRLNDQQAKDFVKKWNASKSVGPCKYIPIYWLTIILTDGSTRNFRTNADHIKESNDWCYSTGETNYFERLWTENKTE